MATREEIIKQEIDTDPLSRGYAGMTDKQVTDDMNTIYRSAPGGVDAMITYMVTENNRTNNGGDTLATNIMGRLERVATSPIGADVFRQGGLWEAGAGNLGITVAADPANTITFGAGHDVSSINVKDPIELVGFGDDNDGIHRLNAVAGQVLTLEGKQLNINLELNRVAFVASAQRNRMLTAQQRDAAAGIFTLAAGNITQIDFTNTEIETSLNHIQAAGVWGAGDTAALLGLSQNRQSRGTELTVGRVREGDVTRARALP